VHQNITYLFNTSIIFTLQSFTVKLAKTPQGGDLSLMVYFIQTKDANGVTATADNSAHPMALLLAAASAKALGA
jgi:hypothetical protein